MSVESLQILIEAVNNASGPIQEVSAQINRLQQSSMRNLEAGERITNFGRDYTNMVSRPILGALGAATKAAIQYEDTLSDANKALGEKPNTAGAAKLKQEITDLALELGQMPTAIAAMYTEAGKLGVAKGQIDEYTKLVNQSGVAWDMSAGEAGESVSKLTNVLGYMDKQGRVNIGGLTKLGDTINHLADSGATSERAIADVLQRSGGTTRTFGLANESAAALAAGFLNLGYPSEVVGTAINGMLPKLQNASQQTGKFQEALEQIGMPAKQLEKAIKKDAAGAITDLMQKIKDSGDTSIISRLFGDGSDSAMMASAMQNLEQFKKTMGSIKDVESGGMEDSYANKLQTTSSQLKILQANLFVLGANIGAALLPAINGVAKAIQPVIGAIADFAAAHPGITQMAVGFALVVAAIGPLLIIIGQVVSAIGVLQGAFAILKTMQLGASLGMLPTVFSGAAAAAKAFVMALAGAAALGGILAGVAYGVVAIGAALMGNSISVGEFVNVIKTSLMELPANLAQVPAAIGAIFSAVGTAIRMAFVNIGLDVQMMITGISQSFANLGMMLQMALTGALTWMTSAFANLGMMLQMAFMQIQMAVTNLGLSIQVGLMSAIMGIQAMFASMAAMMAAVWAQITAGAQAAIAGMVGAITAGAGQAVAAISSMGAQMVAAIQGIAASMFAAGVNIVNSIAQGIQSAAGSVVSAISSIAAQIRGALPFSPPEWGPLSDIMKTGGNIVNSIAGGIVPGPVVSAMTNALTPAATLMNPGGVIPASVPFNPSANMMPAQTQTGVGLASSNIGQSAMATGGGGSQISINLTVNPGEGNAQEIGDSLEERLRQLMPRLLGDEERRRGRVAYG